MADGFARNKTDRCFPGMKNVNGLMKKSYLFPTRTRRETDPGIRVNYTLCVLCLSVAIFRYTGKYTLLLLSALIYLERNIDRLIVARDHELRVTK